MSAVEDGPKAAGCTVTRADFPRVCISLSCYCAQLGNGSTTAILGLAIPRIAASFNLPCSAFGLLFICSGIGYFAGVNIASALLSSFKESSKFLWTLAFSCVTAAGVFTMFMTTDMWALRTLVFVQYIGIAGVDAFCTVALGEMWGQRVQPWMQSRSAFYAVGGMVPPLVLQRTGSMGAAVAACALLCLSTAMGGAVEMLSRPFFDGSSAVGGKPSAATEMTPLLPKDAPPEPVHGLSSSELVAIENLLAAEPEGAAEGLRRMGEEVPFDSGGSAGSGATLAFATAAIVDSLTHPQPAAHEVGLEAPPSAEERAHDRIVAELSSSIALIPTSGRRLLTVFLFLFCTFSASFVGWFPSFCSVRSSSGEGVPAGLEEKVISLYFFFMSWGCIASIPFSVWLPNRTLLRFHLTLIALGVALLEVSLVGGVEEAVLIASSALMGYGVSSIFPLTMTMANDYGFTADATATTSMLMGGSLGASLVPTAVGYCMKLWGPEVLPACMLVLGVCMGCVYVAVHRDLTQAAAERRRLLAAAHENSLKILEKVLGGKN